MTEPTGVVIHDELRDGAVEGWEERIANEISDYYIEYPDGSSRVLAGRILALLLTTEPRVGE